jgi:hypothetical protein
MAFGFYSPITVNNGQVPSPQTDFPILISLTDVRLKTVANGGHVIHSGGFDIRPYSDSGITTAITGYELVFYDGVNGILEMWVKRASLADGTITYLAYNDASINTDGSSTATWSSSFVNVYHLKDGTTLSVLDARNSANGTNHGATATTGKIDGGAGFASASSQFIDTSSFTGPAAITLSAWVNGTTFPSAYNGVIVRNNAGSTFIGIWVKSNGKVAWLINNSGVSQDGTGTHTLSTATWTYLTMTYDSTSGLVGYVNATSDASHAANGTAATNAIQTDIGQDHPNAGRFWNGALDEVRISSVARASDWITTEYNNQNAPSTFQTLGTEVSLNSIAGLFTK